MIKGVLFDMDGVLVDNTSVHIEAFAIFCERYGVRDWQEKLKTAYGMGNSDILRRIMPEEIIRTRGVEALGIEKEVIYREIYAPHLQPVAGLCELLERLRVAGIRCAVGSSGPAENVKMIIDGCHIASYFDFVVSGNLVSRCKPDPEIYLTASKGLELKPAECLVFEDAFAGIESARRAGIGRIIALATSLTRTELESADADRIIDNYNDIIDLNEILS